MDEYHLIGVPIGEERPAIFELRLSDHVVPIDPRAFNLPKDTPSLDPHDYFVTSGDALAKAIKLEMDLYALSGAIRRMRNKRYKDYLSAVCSCAGRCRSLVNKLRQAKGDDCFLETEWRDKTLVVIPKNPRIRQK